MTRAGQVLHGEADASGFTIDWTRGYPDARSFRRKFGLVIPATNTTMEHELWSLVVRNECLRGIGLQTVRVATPRPSFEDLAEYRRQFLGGLRVAVDLALLARPHAMIMGMSLEHILGSLAEIRAPVRELAAYSGLPWAAWHDAAAAALGALGARRIALLTPFDRAGNATATRMFEELGFEVASSVGFACADARQVALVPDWAKEKAVLERLATPANGVDAVVQCGTNLGMLDIAERLEPVVGVPILGINAVTFWHALRQQGIHDPLLGAGRLLREF